ncbi:MAG: alpha/beta fold hydrolase [Cellvibrionaceae bacterium]
MSKNNMKPVFSAAQKFFIYFMLLAIFCAPTYAEEEPQLREIQSNGITMRIAEMGEGPLVILVHGWPESWYSWRHQLKALADAGYHAVAPDMRGYGKTDKPKDVEAYDIKHLTADIAGIVDAMGEESAILIGHDWGSIVTWNSMLLYPEKFSALVSMSVPYSGRSPISPLDAMRKVYKDNFFYILYFQEWNVAEREFDNDPRGVLSRLYTSPDTPRKAPQITDRKRIAGGFIPRRGEPTEIPSWLTKEDLDFYVNEFSEAGFRGGINYYRNFHRNWEITPELSGAKIEAPVIFLAGELDGVIRRASAEQLEKSMKPVVPNLKEVILIPDTGHWIQQERPEETNKVILDFLKNL